MTTDRGGLQYRIDLQEQQALQGLQQFRKEVRESRAEWLNFRRAVRGTRRDLRVAGELKGLAQATSDVSKSTRELGKASSQRNQATRRGIQSTKEAKRAREDLNSADSRSLLLQRELAKARRGRLVSFLRQSRDSLRNEREKLGVQQAQLRAQERLARTEGLRGQRRDVRTGELAEQRSKRELLEAQNDLEREQSRLNDQQLQQVQAELAAQKRLTRNQQRAALAEQFRERGRDTQTGELATERAKRRILELQTRLEREQEELSDEQLQSLRSQLGALRQIVRAEQRRAQTAGLAGRGLTSGGLSVEAAGLAAFNKDLERLRVDRVRQQLQRANPEFQKLKEELKGSSDAADQGQRRFRLFGGILEKTNERANRISFTFRRLIGIFAAFTAVRETINLFRLLIRSSLQFNAAIEQSELGIASLFTATGQVRDATGQTVSATQQLQVAQRESRRQINLLRRDALATVATFQELRDAFQVAIAPGVDAGLGIDQIRKFSIQISQAAAAIGLEQNQLAEEIRSILAGTIQLRTTRIAAALGITNEDIRQAREAGRLAEFLSERFEAFTVAGQNALTLYNAVIARVRDGVEELIRQGSVEFFTEVKDLLEDVFAGIADINGETIRINPQAIEAVKAIFAGLQRAVVEARRLAGALGLGDFQNAAAAIGDLIGGTAETIGSLIQGFVKGSRDLGRILRPVADTFSGLFPAQGLQELLRVATRVLTVSVGISVAWRTTLGLVVFVARPFVQIAGLASLLLGRLTGVAGVGKQLRFLFGGVLSVVRALLTRFGLVGVAATFLAVELGKSFAEVLGIEVRFGTIVKLVKGPVLNAFKFFGAFVKSSFQGTFLFLKNGFKAIVQFFRDSIFAGAELVLSVLAKVSSSFDDELAAVQKARKDADDGFKKSLEKDRATVKKLAADLKSAGAALKESLEEVPDILTSGQNDQTFGEFAKGLRDRVAEIFSDSVGGPEVDSGQFDDAADSAKSLVERLENLPGIISAGNRESRELSESFRQMAQDLEQAQDDFTISIETEGLDGVSQQIASELAERRVRLAREESQVKEQIRAQEASVIAAQQRQILLQERTNRLGQDRKQVIDQTVEAGINLAKAQAEEGQTQARINRLIFQAKNLRAQGRNEDASALEAETASQRRALSFLESGGAALRRLIQDLVTSLGSQAGPEVLELIEERVKAVGREKVAIEGVTAAIEKRKKIEGEINAISAQRIVNVARRARVQAEQRLQILEAELTANQRLAQFDGATGQVANLVDFAQAQAELQVENQRLELLRQRLALRENADAQAIASLQQQRRSESEIQEVIAGQTAQRQVLSTQIGRQALEVQRLAVIFERERKKLEEPVSFGLLEGFRRFEQQATDTFGNISDLTSDALTGISSTLAQVTTDAIDPTKDADLEQALGNFLLGVVNRLFEQIISQALSSLISSLVTETAGVTAGAVQTQAAAAALGPPALALQTGATTLAGTTPLFGAASTSLKLASVTWAGLVPGLAAAAAQLLVAAQTLAAAQIVGGAAGGIGVGAAQGGPVPSSAPASLAHFMQGVQSLATGGRVRAKHQRDARPSNVDRRDTVPIWARPDEYVLRPEAVRHMGLNTVEMLNRLDIDPTALRALAGTRKVMPRRPRVPSFAGGGLVSRRADRSGRERPQLVRAIVVANEQVADRILNSGEEQQMRFMQENDAEITARRMSNR